MTRHGEVIFEFTRIGNIMRVVAVDAATGIEAVVQGPASAAQADLRAVALKKLQYLLDKKAQK